MNSFCVGLSIGSSSIICALIRPSPDVTPPIEILTNTRGDRSTPLVVSFQGSLDSRLIGQTAHEQRPSNPSNTIVHLKSFIHELETRTDGESLRALQSHLNCADFSLAFNDNELGVSVPPKQWVPLSTVLSFAFADVAALVRSSYSLSLDTKISAVVGVPNDWMAASPSERTPRLDTVRMAMEKSSLTLLKFIPEPVAISITHGIDSLSSEQFSSLNLIVDIGSIFTSLSLLRGFHGGLIRVEDSHTIFNEFCGDRIDNLLAQYFHSEFLKQNPHISPSSFPLSFTSPLSPSTYRLVTQSEVLKRVLSASATASIELDSLFDGIDFHHKMSRLKFAALPTFAALLKSLKKRVGEFLVRNGLMEDDVDRVILSGGGAKIPKVIEMFKGMKCKSVFSPPSEMANFNPEEYVAVGAAKECLLAVQKGLVSFDECSNPTSSGLRQCYASHNARIQGYLRSPIGIGGADGQFFTVFPALSPLPCVRTLTVTSPSESDKIKLINIYQGDSAVSEKNTLIGQLTVVSIDSVRIDMALETTDRGIEMKINMKNGAKVEFKWDTANSNVISTMNDADIRNERRKAGEGKKEYIERKVKEEEKETDNGDEDSKHGETDSVVKETVSTSCPPSVPSIDDVVIDDLD